MTQTVKPVESGLEPIMAEPAPRRRFMGRLSLGHMVMILAGLLAFLLVLVVLRDNSATNFIARAARDIPAGTTIGADDVELFEISGEALAETVLTSDQINQVIVDGQVTNRAISIGTLLQQSDFGAAGAQSTIRSMSIPIAPARAVAGSLKVGDRVDIVASDDEGSWYVTTSAEVLSVSDPATGGFASNDYTLTVVVDPAIGLRLACAMENYHIDVVRATGAAVLSAADFPEACG